MKHDWQDAIQTEFWRRINSNEHSPLREYQANMARFKRQDAVRDIFRRIRLHNVAVRRQNLKVE